jgi:glycosyltransferase involved in cell wall biosynthesis
MKELPLVSFCLLTYNQEDYIGEALDGALSQDYKNLEIIISDDCSTDSTWYIIQKICAEYNGIHKLILNKNVINLGLAAHVNKLYYELSKGKYVAVAAGDDISLPQRISYSISFMEKHQDIVAISTGIEIIDSKTQLHSKQSNQLKENQIFNLDYYLSNKYQHVNGPSRIVKRSLIEAYPPLKNRCPTEDTTTLLRAFMYGKVGLLSEKLVKYRLHESNISSPENIRKMKLEYIFEQNFIDIEHAEKQLFIDSEISEKLKSKVNLIMYKRLNTKNYNRVFQKIINLIRSCLKTNIL